MRWLDHEMAVPGFYFFSWSGWLLYFLAPWLPANPVLYGYIVSLALAFSMSRIVGRHGWSWIPYPEIYGLVLVLGLHWAGFGLYQYFITLPAPLPSALDSMLLPMLFKTWLFSHLSLFFLLFVAGVVESPKNNAVSVQSGRSPVAEEKLTLSIDPSFAHPPPFPTDDRVTVYSLSANSEATPSRRVLPAAILVADRQRGEEMAPCPVDILAQLAAAGKLVRYSSLSFPSDGSRRARQTSVTHLQMDIAEADIREKKNHLGMVQWVESHYAPKEGRECYHGWLETDAWMIEVDEETGNLQLRPLKNDQGRRIVRQPVIRQWHQTMRWRWRNGFDKRERVLLEQLRRGSDTRGGELVP